MICKVSLNRIPCFVVKLPWFAFPEFIQCTFKLPDTLTLDYTFGEGVPHMGNSQGEEKLAKIGASFWSSLKYFHRVTLGGGFPYKRQIRAHIFLMKLMQDFVRGYISPLRRLYSRVGRLSFLKRSG